MLDKYEWILKSFLCINFTRIESLTTASLIFAKSDFTTACKKVLALDTIFLCGVGQLNLGFLYL